MTNGILTLRFDRSGEISSCTDAAGREHAGDGLNRLVVFKDPFQFPFDAWDIDQNYRDLPSDDPHRQRDAHRDRGPERRCATRCTARRR